MSLPTVTYDPNKTIIPRKSFVRFTPVTGGADGTPVDIVGKVTKYGNSFATVMRKIPDADGLLRPDRIVATEHDESLTFEVEDVNILADIFGGSLTGGFKTGRVTLWVVDPDDAATKVAVKSNDFKCTCELDGGLDFSAGVVSQGTLKFTALEKVVLTPDATA